jgi:hypothetical protein
MDDGMMALLALGRWLPGWLLLLLLRLRTILLVATYGCTAVQSIQRITIIRPMHRCTASSQHSCWFSSACAGRND